MTIQHEIYVCEAVWCSNAITPLILYASVEVHQLPIPPPHQIDIVYVIEN